MDARNTLLDLLAFVTHSCDRTISYGSRMVSYAYRTKTILIWCVQTRGVLQYVLQFKQPIENSSGIVIHSRGFFVSLQRHSKNYEYGEN